VGTGVPLHNGGLAVELSAHPVHVGEIQDPCICKYHVFLVDSADDEAETLLVKDAKTVVVPGSRLLSLHVQNLPPVAIFHLRLSTRIVVPSLKVQPKKRYLSA
jgi:hypothetical protein